MSEKRQHPTGLPYSEKSKPQIFSELIYDKRLSAHAKVDWHYLHDHINGLSQCWPSRKTMSQDLGANTHALARQVRELTDSGWLFHPRVENGRYLIYTLLDGQGNVFPKLSRTDAGSGNGNSVARIGNGFKRCRKRKRSDAGSGIKAMSVPTTEVNRTLSDENSNSHSQSSENSLSPSSDSGSRGEPPGSPALAADAVPEPGSPQAEAGAPSKVNTW